MNGDDTAGGPVVTVFRSRLQPEAVDEYEAVSAHMIALASTMPGLVDYKSFRADDGERVTIVTFASRAEHDAWRHHPEHERAQSLGRQRFYAEYLIQVCGAVRENRFTHEG
ncbi:MAG: antibiotic biosynthesis monooxygenase family protein [Acidimicrobiales bacterium]